jgi:hypothetical protein
MKRSNIKQAFGGEVPFTKFISRDAETSNRLLASCELSFEDGYSVKPEEHTADDKRVDLVIRDSHEEIILVVESQDATGWLDSVHASKITYYMYDRGVTDAVLLCEDADEHIKGFVKYLNDTTQFNITLMAVIVYEDEPNPYCEFVPLIRPSSITERRVRRVSSSVENPFTSELERIADQNPGLFTHQAKNWNSNNNVANTGVNLVLGMNNTHFRVSAWHGGRRSDDQTFKKSFGDFCTTIGYESRSRKDSEYITIDNEELAIKAFQEILNGFKSQNVIVGS